MLVHFKDSSLVGSIIPVYLKGEQRVLLYRNAGIVKDFIMFLTIME